MEDFEKLHQYCVTSKDTSSNDNSSRDISFKTNSSKDGSSIDTSSIETLSNDSSTQDIWTEEHGTKRDRSTTSNSTEEKTPRDSSLMHILKKVNSESEISSNKISKTACLASFVPIQEPGTFKPFLQLNLSNLI